MVKRLSEIYKTLHLIPSIPSRMERKGKMVLKWVRPEFNTCHLNLKQNFLAIKNKTNASLSRASGTIKSHCHKYLWWGFRELSLFSLLQKININLKAYHASALRKCFLVVCKF